MAKPAKTPQKSQPKPKKQPQSKTKQFVSALRRLTWRSVAQWVTYPFRAMYAWARRLRQQGPHQTFVLTRSRDKVPKPKLESFVGFSWYVAKTLGQNKWLFLRFLALYMVFAVAMVGVVQSENLDTANMVIDSVNEESDSVIDPLMRAVVVASSSLGGALNSNLTDVQQLYMSALYIFIALAVVWLLRQRLAGTTVTVRDGLYSAGAPLVSIYLLVVIGIMQLIPAALGTIVYTSAAAGGLLSGGIETGMFAIALFLLLVLTLYFMTTTLFAIMIATIPGTYPIRAYKTARKIVTGQRARLLVRLFWLALLLLIVWYGVLIPVVIIANSFNMGSSFVIPLAIQAVIGFCLVYGASYCYLLYRRMIDDPVK